MEGVEFLHGGQHCRPATPLCAAAGGDHFAVEDLLDFSNEEGEGGEWELDVCAAGNLTDESSTVTAVDCCSNSLSGCDPHFGSGDLAFKGFADAGLSGDLCGPHEELAELEWLSNFVEESFSSEDLHKPHLLSTTKPTASTSLAATKSELFAPAQLSLFRQEAAVPGKARSKRSRAAPCSWSSRLCLFSPFMSAASSPESELISLPTAAPVKKATELEKKPDLTPAAATAAAPSERRRCLHCQVEKTPQWRAGPMGPKTLCNACGVRYKSGRLVPEYRPAASPNFIPAKHSNSHRKVLELRRQKDLQRQQQQHQLRSDGVGAPYSPEATAVAEPSGDGLLFRQMGPGFRHLM